MRTSDLTDRELADECYSVAASMEKYGGRSVGLKLRAAARRIEYGDRSDRPRSVNVRDVRDILGRMRDHGKTYDSVDGSVLEYYARAIEDALPACSRNCDRFAAGEAEKAKAEFFSFCGDQHGCDKCPVGEVNGRLFGACMVAWLLAPREEGAELVVEGEEHGNS